MRKENEHVRAINANSLNRNYWRDMLEYRELFFFLTWRDILVRYKQTIIGTDADYLAFIDDDETADKEWLSNLINFTDKNNLDCVNGFVQYRYSDTAPKWMERANAHGHKQTTRNLTGSTNNIVYKMQFLKEHNLSYDAAYALSGGEDSFLYKQIKSCGGKCGYCSNAVTYEAIHVDRESLTWICKRFFKYGPIEVAQDKILYGRWIATKILLKKLWYNSTRSIYHLGKSVGYCNPRNFIYSVRCACILAGYITGYISGMKIQHYAK